MAETKFTNSVGVDVCAPYGVYLNCKQVAVYDCPGEAFMHQKRLMHSFMTPMEISKERDQERHALQAPISSPRYRVLYLKNGKEHHSAWLYREEHAQKGLAMMRAKYGKRNAIIYVD